MKTRFLIIGIIVLVGSSVLSALGLVAGQELNNQGNTDIFPDDWNEEYNPTIGYVFAWITILFIPVSIIGIAIIIYSLFSIFTKYAKQVGVITGISLLCAYGAIIIMEYPYT